MAIYYFGGLEVTFSFDNAVINSKVLAGMSQVWQKVFLTAGIFVAVFVVRFILPIAIVMIASGHGFMDVVNLALHKPVEYGKILHEASPMIDAFGGAFLIMIGLSYFIDYNKRVHWMRHVEPILAKAGRFENFKVCIMLSVAAVLYFTVEAPHKSLVLISAVLGIVLRLSDWSYLGHFP